MELHLKFERKNGEFKVVINDAVWEIVEGSYIARNGKTLAYYDRSFRQPFEAAIATMLNEIKTTIRQFEGALEKEVESIEKGEVS